MRAHHFILREYSRDVTAQKLGQPLLAKFRKEPPQWQQRVVGDQFTDDQTVLQYLLGLIEKSDPTKNKQYVPWIIRNYVNNSSLKFEDATTKVTEPLLKFYKLVNKKQIPAPNNDIGRIKDLAQLVQLVDQFPDVEEKAKDANRGQAKEVYRDQDIRIIMPEDTTAACYYGQGTKWCTAAANNNMFDRYNKEGPMYIIIPTKPAYAGEKYQLHFPTRQFMDEKDQRVNMAALRQRFPQLADVFEQQANEFNILALRKDITDLNATLQQAVPLFAQTLTAIINREAKAKAREIYVELTRAVKIFKGMEELWELAEDMFDTHTNDLVRVAANIVRNDPDAVNDDDILYDELANELTEVVRDTELWNYAVEILEDLEEAEAEFDVAMTIEGELNSLMQKAIPEAFGEAVNAVLRSQH